MTKDQELRARAEKVVPSGMWGHLHAAGLPENYPQYFKKSQGCSLWDVNDRHYIDYMCGWGPNLLGYKNKAVDDAAAKQALLGDCMNGPQEIMVELAELFVRLVKCADWVEFQKNGTDATTLCLTMARAATEKKIILVAKEAYHGAVPWCNPFPYGVTPEDRANLRYFEYNNIESLTEAVMSVKDDLAGIIVSSFKHDYGKKLELPTLEFAQKVRELCDQTKSVLIMDEVRAGFRLNVGNYWDTLGVDVDLIAWSKAIANGYSISAVTGRDWLKGAAAVTFSTGSFWFGSVSMAACYETLSIVEKDNVPHKLEIVGNQLREGLYKLAQDHQFKIFQSGPVQMPLMHFENDEDYSKITAFCMSMIEKGVYFHPMHNMFLCAAHTSDDISATLEIADAAFSSMKAM